MATQVQFRGGTTAEHANFNGAAKEVTVDTTIDTLVVHTNNGIGTGIPLLRAEGGAQDISTTGDISAADGTFTGDVSAVDGTFTGDATLTGDLTINTDAFFVDASTKKVGVGTASPSGLFAVHQADSSTSNYINITNDATGASSLGNGMLVGLSDTGEALCWQNESLSLKFGTNNTEAMQINSSQSLLIGPSGAAATTITSAGAITTAGVVTSNAGSFVTPSSLANASNYNMLLGEVGGSEVYSVKGDGAASFAGSIDVAGPIGNGESTSGASLGAYGQVVAQRASGNTVWSGYQTGTSGATSVIYGSGAAFFDGDVFVGRTSDSYDAGISLLSSGKGVFSRDSNNALTVNRGSDDGALVEFKRAGSTKGSISVSGSTTAYNTSSDYRLKENVVDVTDGIVRVKQLQPRKFNFIADADTTVDGFLAHEAQTVVPEAITGEKDAMKDEEYEVTPAVEASEGVDAVPAVMGTRSVPDYQGIDQSKLVPLLTAALQEAITKIETLETKVAALEAA